MSIVRNVNIHHRQPVVKLALINQLLLAFNNSGINYCHWKSSEHLDASMLADTDLDILFDLKQKDELERLLGELGIKKFEPAKQKQYKDIEDYIGLDFPSGKIVHLHTHFKLTIGEINLKSYQLNLEDKILNSRVYDEKFGIYRIDPAFELVLLFYRQALKIRNRDRAKIYLKNEINFTGNIVNEYEWLKKRCTDEEIEAVLKTILTDDYESIYQLVTGKFNRIELIKLAQLLKKKYKSQRLYSPLKALMLRWYRELYTKGFRKYSRLVNSPVVLLRINPRGGLVIAIIGADGSGKSTVINSLQSTFKKKLDVYKIYFGQGVGKISWYRGVLSSFKRGLSIIKKSVKTNQTNGQKQVPKQAALKNQFGIITSVYDCIESLMVAQERYSNLKRMQIAKKRGMLVICDRYPQNQFWGYNDGPRLQHLAQSKNPFLRIIAKREARIYKLFEQKTPDIIFKLIADAEVIEARKPGETSLEILRAKIDWVKQLKFPDNCQVVTVNAEEPLEKVLFTIRKKIWEAYN